MNNTKFVVGLLMLNKVLNNLSKLSQKDHTCYTCVIPALDSIKAELKTTKENFDTLAH